MRQLIKLAYKLCSIPSVSGDEASVLAYLCSWLAESGLVVEKIPVGGERFNIFAYRKLHAQYTAILCTHVDTVAPHVKPNLDDDKGILSGRGSCDAKGIVAAMIYAALAQFEVGFDDVALLFTVGEEEASDGAKACLPQLAGRARYVIVGEPTELRAACGQKGSLVFDLKATGVEAHSSQPDLGDSAIHKLVHDIGRLIAHAWPQDAQFGPTLVNFGVIEGGSMRNMLAKEARAMAIMRTSVNNQLLVDEITRMLSPGVSIEILSSEDPFLFFAPDEYPHFLAAFGSDAPYLRRVGTTMLIGPGSLSCAHTPHEHVAYADLAAGMRAYDRIITHIRNS